MTSKVAEATSTSTVNVAESLGISSRESESGQCDETYFRRSFVEKEPPMSECARVGKRALSWGRWIPGLSDNAFLGSLNKEFSHAHVYFEASGHDIGFGTDGLFSEKVGAYDYRFDEACYDGTLMRRAIAATERPSFYGYIFKNCQTYIEEVLKTYEKLKSARDSK